MILWTGNGCMKMQGAVSFVTVMGAVYPAPETSG
jgi:hypothetical protein